MSEIYDLHCHSTASDGSLTPTELLQRAHQQGVTTLALTDHDTIQGQAEAAQAAAANNIQYIPGIEISTNWQKKCFHIVGLNIDPNNENLQLGIENLQTLRTERAKKIALKLEKKRIPNAYEEVTEMARGGMITRAHFANFLLKNDYVNSQQQAFDRYLGKGKPAFVATVWPEMEQTLDWIKQAGGIAVIAHPLRYPLTASWMKRFLTAFKEMGGQGIEVVTGRSSVDEIHRSLHYAKSFKLAASVGSDFHSPDQWVELGRLNALPNNIPAVWELFE